ELGDRNWELGKEAPISQLPTPTSRLVDRLCEGLFLTKSAREQEDNLIFVRERLLRSEAENLPPVETRTDRLVLYRQFRAGTGVARLRHQRPLRPAQALGHRPRRAARGAW